MTQKSSNPANGDPTFDNAPFSFAPNGVLRREDFTRERVSWLRERSLEIGEDWILSHEERDASRAAIMADIGPREDVWVFGYGSLMWNPAFHVAETERAQIYGYHRSFCLNLILGRGSPERPGLMLGLDRGGSCVGLAHKIEYRHVDSELEILWYREMLGGTYVPIWLTAQFDAGPQKILTFVANRNHQRYIGPQDTDAAARRIASSEGYLGDNRTYLYNTVRDMDRLGIGDGYLHRLERKVRRIAKEPREQ